GGPGRSMACATWDFPFQLRNPAECQQRRRHHLARRAGRVPVLDRLGVLSARADSLFSTDSPQVPIIMQSKFKTLIGVAASLALAPAAFGQAKIAFVDYQRLLQESPQARAATQSLESEFGPKQKQLE